VVLVSLSGRGDKDVDTAARWFGVVSDDAIVESAAAVVETLPTRPPGRLVTPLGDALARARPRAGRARRLPAGRLSDVAGAGRRDARDGRGRVDVVEVGLPYSDPLMDGPTIQAAVQQGARHGHDHRRRLRTVERVARTGAPVLVMTYWNPVDRYGVDRFARDLAAAGGAGLITPDLTPDEAGPWLEASDAHGLDRVFLVAPSSTDERLRYTTEHCRGFVYAAALMGVTGARDTVAGSAADLVARTRAATDMPVCVGLGVSNGAQAAEIAGYADGVIVGSAFVRRMLDATDDGAGSRAVRALAEQLAEGVRARVTA
jgi:tryptophan synthase alpha chain